MRRKKKHDDRLPIEESHPICPICGKHTIEVEKEAQKYKDGDEEFTLIEYFFRCHADGEIYATPEMVERNTNQLKHYLFQKELEKKRNKNTVSIEAETLQ